MARKPRLSPSGPLLPEEAAGTFMTALVAVPTIELSDGNPSPQSVTVTLATQADVGSLTKVTVTGWGTISLSADETGSPSLSDGSIQLEVSWDGGSTFQASTPRLWGGGGTGNSGTLIVPLFTAESHGPPTGDVLLRITLVGEPVGGSEGLTIGLVSELSAIFA